MVWHVYNFIRIVFQNRVEISFFTNSEFITCHKEINPTIIILYAKLTSKVVQLKLYVLTMCGTKFYSGWIFSIPARIDQRGLSLVEN